MLKVGLTTQPNDRNYKLFTRKEFDQGPFSPLLCVSRSLPGSSDSTTRFTTNIHNGATNDCGVLDPMVQLVDSNQDKSHKDGMVVTT